MLRLIGCILFTLGVFFADTITGETVKSCTFDPNAYIGCSPDYCGQKCFEQGNPRVTCPHACIPGGCRCNEGFKYDENVMKCVPEDQCTRPC